MKRTVVVTSIANEKNKVLKAIRDGCVSNDMEFIVVGDKKSPDSFQMNGCAYYSVSDQMKLDYQMISLLPYNHYSRKNIGYLEAIRKGSRLIIDTDDDNIPLSDFWNVPNSEWSGPCIDSAGWVNVYSYFSDEKIWPRGFPLDKINNIHYNLDKFERKNLKVPIRQGLADDNPDVDAIYRMVGKLPLKFNKGENIALGKGSICPFNSQNTQFFPESFLLLYLPSYCSFRMTDIWRSFIAQVVGWQYDWCIGFTEATVIQERNEHNLMKDFNDEIDGYLNNEAILDILSSVSLDKSPSSIGDNMVKLYESLVRNQLIDSKEIPLLESWINDVNRILL